MELTAPLFHSKCLYVDFTKNYGKNSKTRNTLMADNLTFIEELYKFEKNEAINTIKNTYPESFWRQEEDNWILQNPNSTEWLDRLTNEKYLIVTAFIKANNDFNEGVNIEPIDSYVKSILAKNNIDEEEINEMFVRFAHDIRSLSLFARQFEIESQIKIQKDDEIVYEINDDDFLYDNSNQVEFKDVSSIEIKPKQPTVENTENNKLIDDIIDSEILLDNIVSEEKEEPFTNNQIVTEQDFIDLEENGFEFLGNVKTSHSSFVNGDLVFDQEVSSNQLWFKNVNGDLVINILGTDEEIIMEDWFDNPTDLGKVLTGDGISLSHQDIEDFVAQMSKYDIPEDISMVPPPISLLWSI